MARLRRRGERQQTPEAQSHDYLLTEIARLQHALRVANEKIAKLERERSPWDRPYVNQPWRICPPQPYKTPDYWWSNDIRFKEDNICRPFTTTNISTVELRNYAELTAKQDKFF